MSHSLPPRATAVLLALVLALLVFRLGAVPLVGPDEPRYTRVAVEMHRAGEWVTPTLQGEPWLEKTPLFYWLAGGAFSVLGETEAAARVPSVLAALLLVGATALFGARLYGSAAGLHAGFVAGTSLLPFAYGRAASMDMLLAATVTVAIGLTALRVLGVAGRLAIVAAAAVGGPRDARQGAARPAAAGPGPRRLPRRHARVALAPGGALARVARGVRDRGRPLVRRRSSSTRAAASSTSSSCNHNVQRFTSTVHNHPGAFWYYVPVLLAGLFPWSGLAVPALFRIAPRASRRDLFVLLWLALPLVVLLARRARSCPATSCRACRRSRS